MKGIRRILIINGKGGCGKTTIATNLAVAYAQQGRRTALLDYDSQASSTDWSELRLQSERQTENQTEKQSAQAPGRRLAPLQVIPSHKRVGMYQTKAFSHQLASDIERIVIDTPSGARERDIDTLIKQCDVVLVPMLSSPLDIRSGSRFIAELLTHRAFRAHPRSIGVIANRQKFLQRDQNPELTQATADRLAANQQKLLHALECLDVPCVANFTDSDHYGYAAEEGMGITELQLTDATSKAEQARWFDLVSWVDAQPKRAQRPSSPARAPSTRPSGRPVRDGEQADGAIA